MLAPERWARVRGLLEAVVELPPGQRLTYLADACPDDPAVRSEVESLLRAHDAAGAFLDPVESPGGDTGPASHVEPSLTAGTCLGNFEIVEELGAGGMGRVYRARDTRLDRTVALKVIAPALAGEPWHRERFEREARAISRLTHPNICVLHDVGHAAVDGSDRQFLVMELVVGEPLSTRLARGALPVDVAIQLARQMAEALAAAHAAGIVHGDLKPANVMLTKTGIKLLDFGLARLHDPAAKGRAPAPVTAMRELGIMVGTVPYMAPEQLRGEDGDARSDLFAFGAVVYEMLTGRRAFGGEAPAEIVTAILESGPPDVSELQPQVPPALARFVGTCLAKDPADRWQSAHDVALRLRDVQEASHQAPVPQAAGWPTAAVVGLVITGAVTAALGWAWVSSPTVGGSRDPAPRRTMLDAAPVAAGQAWAPMLSPDGRAVAFVAGREGGDRFVVIDFETGETRQLPLRPGACVWGATWSPEGRTLLYGVGDALVATSAETGATQTIARSSLGSTTMTTGVTRNATGTFLIGGTRLRVLSPGSDVLDERPDPNPSITAQLFPSFLPDGRAFVYTQTATDPAHEGVFLGSLDSERSVRLLPALSNAQVSAAGYLVYGADGSVLARRFDLARHSLEGEATSIATDVQTSVDYTHFALGDDHTLTYVRRHSGAQSQLQWFDRDGTPRETVGGPLEYRQIAIARDARRVVAEGGKYPDAGSGLWVIDLARGSMLRANLALQGADLDASWAPDGRRIAFTAWVHQDPELFTMTPDSAEPPVQLAKLPSAQWAQHWSRDGRWILYVQSDSATISSVWALPVDGGPPRKLVDSRFGNFRPELSPDNRWLAYVSDESGRHEVYVQRWEDLGERWKVSSNGGGQPKWRADGRELFYVALDATMMSVAVPPDGLPGEPRPLFRVPLEPDPALNKYAVTPDGRRFLVISPIESAESASLAVVSNWPALVQK